MPRATDFRTVAFAPPKVDSSGKHIGQTTYWKLYAIENLFRVIIHSVLTAQLGPTWWANAVDRKIQERALNARSRHAKRPWHTNPGTHDIYYTNLSDLSEIMRANAHLFRVTVQDIDEWIVKIHQVLLPRNVVGHMNFPNSNDKQRIDVLYSDCQVLIAYLQRQPPNVLPLLIP
jgi:hypothetical protein